MLTQFLHADRPADLEAAATLLRAGKLVAMPTETVYGLAGDARSPLAVAAIFSAKARPAFDPLIVHVSDIAAAEKLVHFSVAARRLAEVFWPGPLTLVCPRRAVGVVDDLVSAGLPSIGIRVPAKPAALALLRASGLPLAAPSANRFGSISPTTAAHVAAELGGRIAAILDGGPCECGIESTVVKCVDGCHPVILRLGALAPERIAEVLGQPVPVRLSTANPGAGLEAPGQVERHYAPRTPMRVFEAYGRLPPDAVERTALLAFGEVPRAAAARYARVENLSLGADSVEAAARIFSAMRALDDSGFEAIDALLPPADAQGGLGPALRDRLTRASAKT